MQQLLHQQNAVVVRQLGVKTVLRVVDLKRQHLAFGAVFRQLRVLIDEITELFVLLIELRVQADEFHERQKEWVFELSCYLPDAWIAVFVHCINDL